MERGVGMVEGTDNHREYFRLSFDDLTATMQIFQVDENPISVEPRAVQITDLGGGGLSIVTDVDLPIRLGLYATFAFTLRGQSFSLSGQLVRKTDDMVAYTYGVSLVDVEEHEQEALVSLLGRIEIERARKARAGRPQGSIQRIDE